MSRQSRQIGRLACLLLFLMAMLPGGMAHGTPRQNGSTRSLLAISKKEADVHTRDTRGYYAWLSTHEVLYQRAKSRSRENTEWSFFKRDIATGRDTFLRRLSRVVREQTGSVQADLEPSPDGKWVIWSVLSVDAQWYVVCSLDGSSYFPAGEQGLGPFWLNDSRHWVDLVDDTLSSRKPGQETRTQALIHDIKAPHEVKSIPLPHLSLTQEAQDGNEYAVVHAVVWPDTFVMETPLLHDSSHPAIEKVTITTIALRDRPPTVHEYPVNLPNGVSVRSMQFSPHGDRIAWWLEEKHNPGVVTLWISDLNGHGLRELGEIGIEPSERCPLTLCSLEWLPDGKRLSFLYQDALWTVPVS